MAADLAHNDRTFLNLSIHVSYMAPRDYCMTRVTSVQRDAPKELASGIKKKKYDHFLRSDELNGKKLVYNVTSRRKIYTQKMASSVRKRIIVVVLLRASLSYNTRI